MAFKGVPNINIFKKIYLFMRYILKLKIIKKIKSGLSQAMDIKHTPFPSFEERRVTGHSS